MSYPGLDNKQRDRLKVLGVAPTNVRVTFKVMSSLRWVRTKAPPRTITWAFSYYEIAKFLGLSVGTVKNLVYKGSLDPSSLESLFQYRLKKNKVV